jgi:hypothetical protein
LSKQHEGKETKINLCLQCTSTSIIKVQNLLPLFIEEEKHDELQRLEFPEQATRQTLKALHHSTRRVYRFPKSFKKEDKI